MGLPPDQEPNPHLLIATPLHGVEQVAKGTHRLILYLLHALHNVYLEALPHLLWLGRMLLPIRRHDTKDGTRDKTQITKDRDKVLVCGPCPARCPVPSSLVPRPWPPAAPRTHRKPDQRTQRNREPHSICCPRVGFFFAAPAWGTMWPRRPRTRRNIVHGRARRLPHGTRQTLYSWCLMVLPRSLIIAHNCIIRVASHCSMWTCGLVFHNTLRALCCSILWQNNEATVVKCPMVPSLFHVETFSCGGWVHTHFVEVSHRAPRKVCRSISRKPVDTLSKKLMLLCRHFVPSCGHYVLAPHGATPAVDCHVSWFCTPQSPNLYRDTQAHVTRVLSHLYIRGKMWW